MCTQDIRDNIRKKVSYHKILEFVQRQLAFRKFAAVVACILLLFRVVSSTSFKIILVVLLLISIILNILSDTMGITMLIIDASVVLILTSDYVAIAIADRLNAHIAALLRGLKLSTRLGGSGFPIFIYKNVVIREPRRVFLGDNVAIYENAVLIPGRGYIIIGDDSHIDSLTVIHGSGGVEIGSKVAIASGVIIYSQTNQYKEGFKPIIEQPIIYGKVIIEDDVWIGAGAIILPNVRIRKGAIIGAGALILMNSELEEYTIYVGVPAKPLKRRVD